MGANDLIRRIHKILESLGITVKSTKASEAWENTLLDTISTKFSDATNQVLTPLTGEAGANFMISVIIPISICLMVVFFLMGLLDKVDKKGFNVEILIRQFIKLIVASILITNSFGFCKGIDAFTGAICKEVSAKVEGHINELSKEKYDDDTQSQRDSLFKQNEQNLNRLDPSYDPNKGTYKEKKEENKKKKDEKIKKEQEEAAAKGETPIVAGDAWMPVTKNIDAISLSNDEKETLGKITAKLKTKGLSDAAIIGIEANLYTESGFNPKSENPSSGAYGIAQWMGGLKANLTKRPNYDTLDVQLDYLCEILKTNWMYSADYCSFEQFCKLNDPLAAAFAFRCCYERGFCFEGASKPSQQLTEENHITTYLNKNTFKVLKTGRKVHQYHIDYVQGAKNTVANTKGIMKVYGVIASVSGTSDASKVPEDIFTNSLTTSQALGLTLQVGITAITIIVLSYFLIGIAYLRAIKLAYLIILMPLGISNMFSTGALTQKPIAYVKKLLATFLQYPACYIIGLFAIVIQNASVSASSSGVSSLLGVLIMVSIILIQMIRNSADTIEQLLS